MSTPGLKTKECFFTLVATSTYETEKFTGPKPQIKSLLWVAFLFAVTVAVGCGSNVASTLAPSPNPTPTPTVSNGHFRALKSTANAASISAIRPNQASTSTANMAYPRVYATATLLANGQVLVAGGSGSANTAEVFDPSTETFTLLQSELSWSRVNPCAVTLPDGQVVLIGGWENGIPPNVDIFDPTTNTFSAQTLSGPLPDTSGENAPNCFPLPGKRIFLYTDNSGPMILDANTWGTHELQVSGDPSGIHRGNPNSRRQGVDCRRPSRQHFGQCDHR